MADKPGKKKASGGRLKSLETRAKEELDPLWRNWFLEVDRRRKALHDRKQRPFVVSRYEKDGREETVARPKSEPEPLKKFIKVDKKKTGSKITEDLLWLREIWPQVVGDMIAADTEVYAFKNGILTISVFSGVLLQEIRQFGAETIVESLRDVWRASIPLLKIQYRMGKR